MRISDWSSDVCSSDLMSAVFQVVMHHGANCQWYLFRQIQLGRGHGFQHACTKICDDIVVQRAKYRLAAVKQLVEVARCYFGFAAQGFNCGARVTLPRKQFKRCGQQTCLSLLGALFSSHASISPRGCFAHSMFTFDKISCTNYSELVSESATTVCVAPPHGRAVLSSGGLWCLRNYLM